MYACPKFNGCSGRSRTESGLRILTLLCRTVAWARGKVTIFQRNPGRTEHLLVSPDGCWSATALFVVLSAVNRTSR